ncbi:MAG: peptidase domain-containing ABC transporter [Prevotellaceae bacterium]|nr:peptidase domain-containing ABC transporter [Prevotellaceae bacterium]
MPIKIYHQLDSMDCGPTCVRMVARYYGKTYTLQYLREHCFITREGVSLLGMSDAAERIGMRTLSCKITMDQLADGIQLPCILHWNQNHFVVCYKVTGKEGKRRFHIADPAMGKVTLDEKNMRRHWLSTKMEGEDVGIAMEITPGPDFGKFEDENEEGMKNLSRFLKYILPFKRQIGLLLLGSLAVMGLSYVTPFLSQANMDIGIKNRDLDFIVLILIAQLVISVSQIAIGFIQSWISLHMNTRINISLISDYLMRLTRMPLHCFDTKNMGDILQRIGDHGRIKSFLMGDSINIVFSLGTFVVFAVILGIYNWMILLTFLIGNGLYICWILLFMPFRRELDHRRFAASAKLQNNMVQFIQGMQDIKLNNTEKQRRWEWERLQASLYRIGIRGLKLGQIQSVGSIFFSSITGILISYLSARMVVTGEITLGMMIALSFIIGQVSGPIGSFIGFAQSYQDAKISLERLNEINDQEDEDKDIDTKLAYLPDCHDIIVDKLTFSYSGAERDYALQDVTLRIPQNKVTAIVGASGSGKTTLVKLLQGFYQPLRGIISIGNTPLNQINPHYWRAKTGSVMQESYIFSDTIANNIAISTDEVDMTRLRHAVDVANIRAFVNQLPLNYSTKIGMEGNGISQGQRQRILIARAVYKNPEYIFLDEATNSLDANNESIIMKNLHEFYKGKTVVIVAHRLSTVKDADNIVVLDHGRIAEQGTHAKLVSMQGAYYNLVKNQLELGT